MRKASIGVVVASVALVLLAGCGDDDGGSSGSGGGTAATGGTGAAGGVGGTGGTSGVSGGVGGAGSGGTGGTAGSAGSAGTNARPHPLYPALDLDTLPGSGAASGPYEPPMLPTTTRSVTVTTTGNQAAADVLSACQTSGTAVTVNHDAGRIGNLDFGNVTDCDVTLGADVIADLVYVGHLPGPQVAPSHRIRIRGGQLGGVTVDPGSSDIVFDGVTINTGVLAPAQRGGVGVYLINNDTDFVNRFAFVNSIIRMVATLPDPAGNSDGSGYLAGNARNVFFANNNVVTAGNRNSWGFRIGGGDNFIIVDSTVRVSFHKLIRMNDGPVDYVVVRGGVWIREETRTAGGDDLNDAFAQLGDDGTDNVFIHDTEVHLRSALPLNFGAWTGPGQVGKSWQMRNIAWHARSADVISDAILTSRQNDCVSGSTCDYGVGTHSYDYNDNLTLPTDAWRSLPGIDTDNPDDLPVVQ